MTSDLLDMASLDGRPPGSVDEGALDAAAELWATWRRVQENLRTAVSDDVVSATGYSDAEIAILVGLDGFGGTVRQNRLAAHLGWEKSRLSHQLSRMAAGRMLRTRAVDGGREVDILAAGRRAVEVLRPLVEEAVRRHFSDPLSSAERIALEEILVKLGGAVDTETC